MPIYEYNCAKCGVFEVTQRITENALKKCPTCKGKVERIVSRTSFILKGGGWYATDYAKTSGAASKSDSSKSDSPSASDSSSSSAATNGAAATGTPSVSDSSSKSSSEKSTASKATG
jgi:putative FmdB family regulatory protein